tara:strand:+ start:2772 stop:3734 length:963 start_codon:yes stop_codon:yes gene_type:complete
MLKLFEFLKSVLRTKRLNAFFLFFGMAFFILILVKLSDTYTNVLEFKIELKDIPDDIVIEKQDELKLKIEFEATGFFWTRYIIDNPKITLSLSEDFLVEEKTYTLNVDLATSHIREKLSQKIENFKLINKNLKVRFDTYSVKKVPVRANADITFENGFGALKVFELSEDSIKVIGPKDLIDTISYISSKKVTFEKVNASISKVLNFDLENYPETLKLIPEELNIKVNGERFTEGEIDLNVELINVPSELSINYFPKTIKVTYTVPLDDFKAINNSDFKIIADYKKTNTTNNFLFPELQVLNSKIKSTRMKQTKLEYIITK